MDTDPVGRRLWDIYLFCSINNNPRTPELLPRQALAKFARTCNIVAPAGAQQQPAAAVPRDSPQQRAALRRGSMLPTVGKPCNGQVYMLEAEVRALRLPACHGFPTFALRAATT